MFTSVDGSALYVGSLCFTGRFAFFFGERFFGDIEGVCVCESFGLDKYTFNWGKSSEYWPIPSLWIEKLQINKMPKI